MPTSLPLTRRLPSIPSAADRPALLEDFLGTMHLSDLSGPFIVGYSLFGLPDADRRDGRPPGRTGDLPASDAILSCVTRSSTPAERRPSHRGVARGLGAAPTAYAGGISRFLRKCRWWSGG